jgi:pSer/pThr/pTyr-binding forkhead associated (FHA) protein
MMASAVRPYVMDLGSTNGTFLNNERLEAQRYYELYEKVGGRLPLAGAYLICTAACLKEERQ